MEEKKQIYPLEIKLNNNISNGFARGQNNNLIIENEDTVEVKVTVHGSCYSKKDVYESIKEVFQKVLEYYHE